MAKGSQRWTQYLVNNATKLLNKAIYEQCNISRSEEIEWISPLANEAFKEYQDQAFIERLRLHKLKVPLHDFWPWGGAHWDALARTTNAQVLLVEAKSHIAELASTPTTAGRDSLPQILYALSRTQQAIKVGETKRRPELWANAFYQYANRYAHLYFLRQLNSRDARLIFLNFVNDPDAPIPVTSAEEWQSLTRLVEACLGISPTGNPLAKFVHHIQIDVSKFS